MEKQTLPNSTLVLVLGILSIVGCCCLGILGLISGIIALIIASKSKALYNENPEAYNGYDNLKIGRILAIIGIVLSVIYIIYIVSVMSDIGFQAFIDALDDPETLQEILEERQ